MKKSFRFIALAATVTVTAMGFTSCSDEDIAVADTSQPSTIETKRFNIDVPDYHVVSTREYTAQEIADRIYNPAEGATMDEATRRYRMERRQRFLEADALAYEEAERGGVIDPSGTTPNRSSLITTYKETVLEYTTLDHHGNSVKLSGLVAFQHWRSIVWLYQPIRTIDKFLIENHYTITSDGECPSRGGTVLEGAMYTFPGVVMSADYQGYGTSSWKIHPYLNQEVTARQQVDFVKVAIDYLDTESKYITISPELKTYNLGYSQGGAVTVAVQRYLEQNERSLMRQINFRGSIAGDGPYNLVNTFNFYRETGVVNMPIVLPLIVQGMMSSYPELFTGISINDYFTPEFLQCGGGLIAKMNTKEYKTSDFDDIFSKEFASAKKKFGGNWKYDFDFEGYDITKILSPTALNVASPASQALITALSRNNVLNGWTPTYPVYFYHCVKDPVVPYVNLKNMPWSPDIYRIDERTFFENHTYGGYKFYVDLIFSSNIESYFGFFNLERGVPRVDDLPGQL